MNNIFSPKTLTFTSYEKDLAGFVMKIKKGKFVVEENTTKVNVGLGKQVANKESSNLKSINGEYLNIVQGNIVSGSDGVQILTIESFYYDVNKNGKRDNNEKENNTKLVFRRNNNDDSFVNEDKSFILEKFSINIGNNIDLLLDKGTIKIKNQRFHFSQMISSIIMSSLLTIGITVALDNKTVNNEIKKVATDVDKAISDNNNNNNNNNKEIDKKIIENKDSKDNKKDIEFKDAFEKMSEEILNEKIKNQGINKNSTNSENKTEIETITPNIKINKSNINDKDFYVIKKGETISSVIDDSEIISKKEKEALLIELYKKGLRFTNVGENDKIKILSENNMKSITIMDLDKEYTAITPKEEFLTKEVSVFDKVKNEEKNKINTDKVNQNKIKELVTRTNNSNLKLDTNKIEAKKGLYSYLPKEIKSQPNLGLFLKNIKDKHGIDHKNLEIGTEVGFKIDNKILTYKIGIQTGTMKIK